mmetsp:Transcript_40463/g.115330  ORF Transcript_40463/g.115330 Transcript_40463/m.115330 type:complete len:93 (+) Transcript_40463:364-642(+)
MGALPPGSRGGGSPQVHGRQEQGLHMQAGLPHSRPLLDPALGNLGWSLIGVTGGLRSEDTAGLAPGDGVKKGRGGGGEAADTGTGAPAATDA